MRPSGNPKQFEKRRLQGIALLRQGIPPVEVARRLGVDRRSVRRWKAINRKHGPAGLRARPNPGRPRRLSNGQLRQLEKHLLRGAQAAGYPTPLLTCPRVVELIRQKFGIRYHVDHVGRLLHRLGFSPQKPERRAIERDEEEIQRWIKQTWPALKKKPTS